MNLALNASGLVSEVFVTEGQQVEAGQVLARLESNEAMTLEDAQATATRELTEAYQAVRDAQYKLDNFDVPSDFSSLTPSGAVAHTLEKLNIARAAYEQYRYLGQNSSTRREYRKRLDDAWSKYCRAIQWMELQTDADSAQARLTQAQKDCEVLEDSTFGEDTAGQWPRLPMLKCGLPLQA